MKQVLKNELCKTSTDKKFSLGHIFIAYAREGGGDFADLVVSQLERQGFKTWIDVNNISGGHLWRKEIKKAIEDSAAIIIILSKVSCRSLEVAAEFAYADAFKKTVVPILLENCKMPLSLDNLHYLDFTNRTSRPWGDLFKVLKS